MQCRSSDGRNGDCVPKDFECPLLMRKQLLRAASCLLISKCTLMNITLSIIHLDHFALYPLIDFLFSPFSALPPSLASCIVPKILLQTNDFHQLPPLLTTTTIIIAKQSLYNPLLPLSPFLSPKCDMLIPIHIHTRLPNLHVAKSLVNQLVHLEN